MAAVYVQREIEKREFEREKRDRDFWRVMFGGEPDIEPELTSDAPSNGSARVLPETDDELIARSMLGRR